MKDSVYHAKAIGLTIPDSILVAAFRKGLNETGFVEGRNVTIEFRFGYNDNARLPDWRPIWCAGGWR